MAQPREGRTLAGTEVASDAHPEVGEISKNFEDGLLANLDGSWEAGKNGSKPGFWVKAAPQVGEFYRQEYARNNEAEDTVAVVDLDA